MQTAKAHTFIGKLITAYMLVMVIFSSFPAAAFADSSLAVTLTANGQTALTLATSTDSFTVDLTSTNATACQQTSPIPSGISTSASMTITPGHSFYPAIGGSTTFTVTCTDGTDNKSATVVVTLPPAAPAPAVLPTVDIKANGSDGPVTINSGDAYTYTWTSTNATACQQTSPVASGISTSGASDSIIPGHAFYPGTTTPVTLTITCTNGSTNVTDSVVVNLAGSNPPAGGSLAVDIKANGSDGPVTLNSGDTYTYSWTSSNATACQQTSPITSGIATSGVSAIIDSTHTFYPSAALPTTLTITCTNGSINATDSVVVGLGGVGTTTPPNPVTVDIKANGSDGPVTINSGDAYTYTWTSTNATACQQTTPIASGISATGTSASITPGHIFYPTATSTVTLTIICTNGVSNATDFVVIGLSNPSCPVANITSSLAVTVNTGDAFTYVITTANSSTTPVITVDTAALPAGLTYSSTTQTISGTPTASGVSNITITSTNTCGTDTKTLVITVNTPGGGGPLPQGPTPPGGGGGGLILSPGGRHEVPISNPATCLFLKDYMRSDFNNNPEEVMKLQSFLRVIQGYNYVTVNGVFDQATVTGVDAFQNLYRDDILTPWGHTAPTHYVYILTLKKINEIYCLGSFPLNDAQAKEIAAFKALLLGANNQGLPVVFTPGSTTTVIKDISTTTATTTPVELPIVGSVQGQNLRNLAAAIFTAPAGLLNTLQCIYEFLLILIVLYILANVLEDVFIKDTPENVLKKFLTKWSIISLGLTLAIIAAYFYGEWCLILPLLIVLILSVVWMALYPKHSGIKNSTKAWYLVMTARSKSMWKKADSVTSVTSEEIE